MSYTSIITKIVSAFVLASVILYRYGNWFRHHIIVTFIVLLAWFFSLLIILALPLDVIKTVYRQCQEDNKRVNGSLAEISNSTVHCMQPWTDVPETFFPNLWRTVYWTSQCLTWLLMPMMQSYIKAGDFTIRGKLKSALIDNAIYYGTYLFICIILLIYLATKPGIELDWQKLKAIASSASNTWGLFLLVLLLGYALVEVPRSLWRNSNHSYVLNHAYFKTAKLSSDKAEAEETVDDVLESLQALSLIIRPGHYLYENFETIMQKVPIELRDKMGRRLNVPDDMPNDSPSERTLIRLHKQVIKSLQVLQRTEAQWSILVEGIFDLEDTLRNMNSRERVFKHTFDHPKTKLERCLSSTQIEWYWKCVLSNYTKKVLSVLAAVLSIAVVWSEVTFFNKTPVLSIFANIVNVAKARYDYLSIEILSTIVILYLCYCAYSTVLKIRVLNLYYLAPHHLTNEYSLIFSGMMLSRLTPPMCLNFLGLIHMDSHIIKKQVLETQYTQIMGHMDVIAIISDGFNVYFPMAILAFCFATYFSIGARMLSMVGFHQFVGEDEITIDLVNEGRELIKREKRRRQRVEESVNRKREFQERFPSTGRFKTTRSTTDTIRPLTSIRNTTTTTTTDPTRTNLLSSDSTPHHESYEGTRTADATIVDTHFPPGPGGDLDDDDDDLDGTQDNIESRFGVSTRGALVHERYDSGGELEHHQGYQGLDGGYRGQRVGYPPRGIFDDV